MIDPNKLSHNDTGKGWVIAGYPAPLTEKECEEISAVLRREQVRARISNYAGFAAIVLLLVAAANSLGL